MRAILIASLVLAACDLATDAGDGAVGTTADAGPGDLTPPDAECPAYDGSGMVCLGSFEIRNFADIDLVSSCARITGDLELGANGLVEIVLPTLERVDGDVTVVGGSSLLRIEMPDLEEIGGGLSEPALLDELAVPRLRTVGGIITTGGGVLPGLSLDCLDSAAAIVAPGTPVSAPRLTSVPGSVAAPLQAPLLAIIGGTLSYEDGIDLPALYRVTDLQIFTGSSIDLPALKNVVHTGTIGCVAAPTATVLALPALERAGSLAICPWPALTAIQLPALLRIAGPPRLGGLSIALGPGVGPLDLPALATLNGDATLGVATSLPLVSSLPGVLTANAAVDAPVLTTTEGLVLNGPLSAPGLTTVSGVMTVNAPVDLPALATVSRALTLQQGVSGVVSLPALASVGYELRATDTSATELHFAALGSIGRFLWVGDNPTLTRIDFPSLTSLGSYLKINRNPQLPACQAFALRDQLIAAGWTGSSTISGNGSGTCP
jgi:hypothetical protein